MRSRSTKRWIVIGLTLGFLSVSMGAFSAWALTRSPTVFLIAQKRA